jgi:NAD-dependent dihydropyrimidine dehydrogenase PreA subunit
MAFVVTDACVDMLDLACVDHCPVDCIYQGGRSSYIHPDECIECGACTAVCPVDAIAYVEDVPEDQSAHIDDNRAFFFDILPGRSAAVGSPGGAADLGPVGVDTPLVSSRPVLPRE